MSSNDIAIRVSNLSKCYAIYDNPRDRLKQFVMPRLRRLLGRPPKSYYREFWALRDVSFEVKKGETVGIIGRNGSGKSTLLQMICGTLNPTSGSIQTNGRIAALLELGSGFNPEFTGRENVYMNAIVLGLSQKEIDSRFDEIVAFADIGDFIEQPVKTYSSGMYVRLAFAVIVHVDADILIVDEALAVGDMYFQAKCMGHMKKLMNSGVTVLFVSHDVNAVKALCSRAIYLEHGGIVTLGGTQEVVEAYYGGTVRKQQEIPDQATSKEQKSHQAGIEMGSMKTNEEFSKRANFQRIQNGMAHFVNVALLDENGKEVQQVDYEQNVVLRFVFKINSAINSIGTGYHIRDKNGFELVYSDTSIEKCDITNCEIGECIAIDWKFRISLREGDYAIATMLSIPKDLTIGHVEVCDFVPLASQFHVGRGDHLPIYGAVHWENKVELHRVRGRSEASK